jgi:hypothetical protein
MDEKLDVIKPTTHYVSKQVHCDIVLYNNQAVKGIHPVSDENFAKNIPTPRNAKINSDLISLGYTDSEHFQFYYQILNGVSGYVCYQFAYELKTDEDYEEYEDDEENENSFPTNSKRTNSTTKLSTDNKKPRYN